jgi:Zn-dependent peptidase ImmA (M78 family)/transcriptional regulator with XRE-family HTH domain
VELPSERPTSINAAFLALAMNLRGMKFFTALADRAGMDESTLRKWVNGITDEPMLRSYRLIEDALSVPTSLLTLPGTPPSVSGVSFRSRSRELDLVRLKATAYTAAAGMAAEFLLGSAGIASLRAATSASRWPVGPGSYEALAVGLRRDLGLADQEPVGDIVRLAEDHDVLVLFAPPEMSDVEPFSAMMAGIRVIVVPAQERTVERFRFDVAHELGHFVLHPTGSPGFEGERDASSFAAAFLYPPTIVNDSRLRAAIAHRDLELLENIRAEWGVSLEALMQIAKRRVRGPAAALREKFLLIDDLPVGPVASEGEAGSPNLLPDAADAVTESGGRPVHLSALEAGIPVDVMRTVCARTLAEVRRIAA